MPQRHLGTQPLTANIPSRAECGPPAIPPAEDISPNFWQLSMEAQNFALRLAWMQPADGIRVREDSWESDCLRHLQIGGRSRGNSTRHLRALMALGLVRVEGGVVVLDLGARVSAASDVQPTATRHPLDIHLHLSVRNDSGAPSQVSPLSLSSCDLNSNSEESSSSPPDVSIKLKEEQRSCQIAAPPPPLPPRPPTLPPPPPEWDDPRRERVRRAVSKAYLPHGLFPNERKLHEVVGVLVPFCEAKAREQGQPFATIVDRVVAGFFANEKAAQAGFPLGYLRENPLQYFGVSAIGGEADVKAKFEAAVRHWNSLRGTDGPERRAAEREARRLGEELDRIQGKVRAA